MLREKPNPFGGMQRPRSSPPLFRRDATVREYISLQGIPFTVHASTGFKWTSIRIYKEGEHFLSAFFSVIPGELFITRISEKPGLPCPPPNGRKGLGLFSIILEEAMRTAREQGIRIITIRPQNEKLAEYYSKFGFVKEGGSRSTMLLSLGDPTGI